MPLLAIETPTKNLPDLEQRAQSGEVKALLKLGVMCRDGRVVEQDEARAIALFRRAVDAGSPAGEDHLGWMYFRGLGVDVDFGIAGEHFQRSADAGFAQGQFNLGRIHADGLGVEQDVATGRRWWRRAAEGDNPYAAHRLALLSLHGWTEARDMAETHRRCRQSFEGGHDEAGLLLGLLHFEGLGTPVDVELAQRLWREAYAMRAKKAKEATEAYEGWVVDESVPIDKSGESGRSTAESTADRVDMFGWLELRRGVNRPGKRAFVDLKHLQQGWNMCAPTAAAIALGAWDRHVWPYDLKRDCKGSETGGGTDWALLVEAIGKQERRAKIVTFSRDEKGFQDGMALLRTRLDAGDPVLVDIREKPGGQRSAHTVVAVGYDTTAGRVILHDPAIGLPGLRILTESRFREIWHSAGYTRTAPEVVRPAIVVDFGPTVARP